MVINPEFQLYHSRATSRLFSEAWR